MNHEKKKQARCGGCACVLQSDTRCAFVVLEVDQVSYTWAEAEDGSRDFDDTAEMGAWLCEPCSDPLRDLVRRVLLIDSVPVGSA